MEALSRHLFYESIKTTIKLLTFGNINLYFFKNQQKNTIQQKITDLTQKCYVVVPDMRCLVHNLTKFFFIKKTTTKNSVAGRR